MPRHHSQIGLGRCLSRIEIAFMYLCRETAKVTVCCSSKAKKGDEDRALYARSHLNEAALHDPVDAPCGEAGENGRDNDLEQQARSRRGALDVPRLRPLFRMYAER